jgi:holin-like protein
MSKLSLLIRLVLHRSRVLQVGVLAGFWFVGDGVSRVWNLPIPGGIIGLAIVLLLLATGGLRPSSVRRGAYWLLAEMLLFFVPGMMAVLDHGELLGALGLKLLAVILVGTLLVMTGTALTVEILYRLSARYANH